MIREQQAHLPSLTHNDGHPVTDFEKQQTESAVGRVTAQYLEIYAKAHGEIVKKQSKTAD